MSQPLGDERLAAIAVRAAAATPGPWESVVTETGFGVKYLGSLAGLRPAQLEFVYQDEGVLFEATTTAEDKDAEFVAHARQDVPDLLAEVGRLRVQLLWAEACLEDRRP